MLTLIEHEVKHVDQRDHCPSEGKHRTPKHPEVILYDINIQDEKENGEDYLGDHEDDDVCKK